MGGDPNKERENGSNKRSHTSVLNDDFVKARIFITTGQSIEKVMPNWKWKASLNDCVA